MATKVVKKGMGAAAAAAVGKADVKVKAKPTSAKHAGAAAAKVIKAKPIATSSGAGKAGVGVNGDMKKIVKKGKTPGGLAKNAVRNVRDIVTGLPATVELLVKATNPVLDPHFGTKEAAGPKLAKSIEEHDPLYALGDAAVKKLSGDDKGADEALKRAGDRAYERPVDAASYAAGGAALAGRGATLAKHGKGGTPAATARPAKRVDDAKITTKEGVQRARRAASAEVKVKQGKATPAQAELAAKIKRDPATLRKEQRYSPNAATRTVQKARENRKVAKGKDPFVATPRQAKKLRKRRFDEHSRNVHSGGLAREQLAAKEAHEQKKVLKDPDALTAAQLLANERVRQGKVNADLAALERTAVKRDGGDKNARVLRHIDAQHFEDPKVQVVAAAMRDSLRESEGRLKREGFFDGRDGKGTNPDLVAKMQPHLARGDMVQLNRGDLKPRREGGTPPTPTSPGPKPAPKPTPPHQPAPAARSGQEAPAAPKVSQPPAAPVKAAQAPPSGTRRHLDATVERLRVVDEEIALINVAGRAREVYGTGGRRAPKRSGKVRKTYADRMDVGRLRELRAERTRLRSKIERLRASDALKSQPKGKVSKPPPVRELTPLEREHQQKAAASNPVTAERQAAEKARTSPEVSAARVEEARRHGYEPDPRDVARSAAKPAVRGNARVSGGTGGRRVVAPAKNTERQGHAGDKQHQDAQQGRPVVVEPVAHRASEARTNVYVESTGAYWATGPRAGERVNEVDLAGEQGAFIRGLDHRAERSTDLAQPRAGRGYTAEDAILGDLATDRVLATRLDRERQITLIRLARNVEHDFAYRTKNGKSRFTPERADQLAQRLGDRWATLNVSKTEAVIVPREIASRWKQQVGVPPRSERVGRYVTRQFIRTVLPFSLTWQVGNVADLFTRLVAADARFAVPGLAGKSGRDLVAATEVAMRELDPHLAGELTQSLKGHFGARSTVAPLKFSEITQDTRSQFVRDAGEAITAFRDVPVVHQVAEAVRGTTDKLFAAGTKAESAMVSRAAGVAIERYARALGHDVKNHAELGQKLAREFRDDPAKMLEFQRRTLEITGDYVTRGPGLKKLMHGPVPFVQWIRAANKFVFKTLPVGHPYKTAMMLWAASITEEERRELGLSGYITAEEAQKLGLPAPSSGYLAGALRLAGDKSVVVSPLTSFGEAARIIEGAAALASGETERGARLLASPVLLFVQAPAISGAKHGPAVGVNRLGEAFVPGLKPARRALEGERPHPRSTIIKPIGTGGKSTTDRILAAMTAPVGREFPEDEPKAGRPDPNRVKVGDEYTFTTTGPGGRKIRRRVVRKR